MYHGFGGFLIVASLIIAIRGFWILLKFKKYWLILGHLAFIIGFPFFLFWYKDFILGFEGNLLFWLAVPVACTVPVWLMWGFFVNKNAENVEEKEKGSKVNL